MSESALPASAPQPDRPRWIGATITTLTLCIMFFGAVATAWNHFEDRTEKLRSELAVANQALTETRMRLQYSTEANKSLTEQLQQENEANTVLAQKNQALHTVLGAFNLCTPIQDRIAVLQRRLDGVAMFPLSDSERKETLAELSENRNLLKTCLEGRR